MPLRLAHDMPTLACQTALMLWISTRAPRGSFDNSIVKALAVYTKNCWRVVRLLVICRRMAVIVGSQS